MIIGKLTFFVAIKYKDSGRLHIENNENTGAVLAPYALNTGSRARSMKEHEI